MTSAIGSGHRGVTLIELTMVGLLLGLLALIAWPSIRLAARQTLARAEADRQALDARIAREKTFFDKRERP